MTRWDQWKPILDVEMQRWSTMSADQLIAQLQHIEAYEVEHESKKYQVEVKLLENTSEYVHVGIDVDDGSLPASLHPLAASFICRKR